MSSAAGASSAPALSASVEELCSLVSSAPAISARPAGRTLYLFDVDETLTPARQKISLDMLRLLVHLKTTHCAIGFVGGSDLAKITEQLTLPGGPDPRALFDYGFAENGLTAYAHGQDLPPRSFIKWLGEDKYKQLAKYCLRYISELDVPVMRGTFIEFRNGMINVSPIGRNATIAERHAFNAYDTQSGVRKAFVAALEKQFPDWGLRFSIGGQISFDVFPQGWDKTHALQRLEEEAGSKSADKDKVQGWDAVHFVGDKTAHGGNDYEIYNDPRTVGHAVDGPADTLALLREVAGLR